MLPKLQSSVIQQRLAIRNFRAIITLTTDSVGLTVSVGSASSHRLGVQLGVVGLELEVWRWKQLVASSTPKVIRASSAPQFSQLLRASLAGGVGRVMQQCDEFGLCQLDFEMRF